MFQSTRTVTDIATALPAALQAAAETTAYLKQKSLIEYEIRR